MSRFTIEVEARDLVCCKCGRVDLAKAEQVLQASRLTDKPGPFVTTASIPTPGWGLFAVRGGNARDVCPVCSGQFLRECVTPTQAGGAA